jgi:hypothetical protein
MTLALSRRSPGSVPKLSFPLTEADVIALNKFNKRMSEVTQGHPQIHGATHEGGTDDISGSGTPTEIAFGDTGDEGDATQGFAPFDHQHPVSADLTALEGLAGIDTDSVEGASVVDDNLRRILELVALEIEDLAASVERLVAQQNRPLTLSALPPVTITASATSVPVFASRPQRRGFAIQNNSTVEMYLLFGPDTASSSNYTYKITAQGTLSQDTYYGGAVCAAWASGTGSAQATELVGLNE